MGFSKEKPTYEELEAQVKALKNSVAVLKKEIQFIQKTDIEKTEYAVDDIGHLSNNAIRCNNDLCEQVDKYNKLVEEYNELNLQYLIYKKAYDETPEHIIVY